MDLRSIINNEGGDASRQKRATPATFSQNELSRSNSDDRMHMSSPGLSKQRPQDYGVHAQLHTTSPVAHGQIFSSRQSQTPQPQIDCRSSASAAQYTAQSPYRHTPLSASGNQYPFPSSIAPQSPAQAHSYSSAPLRQDVHTPGSSAQPYSAYSSSYQQPSPSPHTPTAAPGLQTHPALQHQRSLSSHSMSTPTSIHSQSAYPSQFSRDSPVTAHALPAGQKYPQHSHPGTPLGPPASIYRQSSGNFPQPTSPHQQRVTIPFTATHESGYQSSIGATRLSNTPSLPESHRPSIESHARVSYSDRERSLSVSPKTRVPSLPSDTLSLKTNGTEQTPKFAVKLEDRGNPEGAIIAEPVKHEMPRNADVAVSAQPPRKRVRYTEPPVWARSILGRVKKGPSIAVPKRILNGIASDRTPAHAQTATNGHALISVIQDGSQPLALDNILGPWEPSITGERPYEELTKTVADWLFHTVVDRKDAGELASRGVEIEIEAKLGQLIDQDINQRIALPVQSECVLTDRSRVSFRSSMTEAQHQALNEYLNTKVKDAHPNNPDKQKSRVPIVYNHRRERDSFYELPPTAVASLPASIRNDINKRHAVKVRVTHDQKTGQELARIIKTRVADLNIYNPRFPLDCRISVNLEMRYDGDVSALSASQDGVKIPDRNKDRLSYKQNQYQIDLTQVTTDDVALRTGKEHELEIELSAAALREQGMKAQAQQPHKYLDLVEAFINNVRVLTRAVPWGDETP